MEWQWHSVFWIVNCEGARENVADSILCLFLLLSLTDSHSLALLHIVKLYEAVCIWCVDV